MIASLDPDKVLMPISESAGALRKSERHPGNAGLRSFPIIIPRDIYFRNHQ